MDTIDETQRRPRIEVYALIEKGHLIPMLKTIEILQLSNANLDISFVTGPLTKEKLQKRYPHIKMIAVDDEIDETAEKEVAFKNHGELLAFFMNYMHKYFQQKTDRPDLIISDFFMLQAFNYANRNGVRFIVNHPNSYAGMSSRYNTLSLERSVRVQGYTVLSPQPDLPLFNTFNKLFESFKNRGVVIYNSFVGLDDPALLPSNYELVGLLPNSVALHEQMGSELAGWMEGWRKKGKGKFLYISFGSMLQLSEGFTKKLLRVIQQLQYPTIWSLRSPVAGQIQSPLIYHREWLPQEAILRQQDVRGYLTHGGWGSISEAIATSTPMVCIPVFGDQNANSKLIHKRRIAIAINQYFYVQVEQQSVARAIRDIMEDGSYSQSMSRMSRLSKTHDAAQNISRIVERLLDFGSEYLISPVYQRLTIKDNSVPLREILAEKYWPLLQKNQ